MRVLISSRIAFLLVVLVSCSELDEDTMELQLEYQPLQIGSFWEYHVEETMYFGESDLETSHYFYRDEITSDYRNDEGERVFFCQRWKSSDQQTWQQEKTFTYRISRGALLKTMDNQTFVSFVFPPVNDKSWNGNNYNSLQEDFYSMNLMEKYILGNWEFKSAAKVVQNEEDDLITFRDNRYEVFVKGVGLVESYYEVLTYCSRIDCLSQQIIDSGRFAHLKLINNG